MRREPKGKLMKLRNPGWLGICTYLSLALTALPLQSQSGPSLYKLHCASCHETSGASEAPSRAVLQQLSPEQILVALETGAMSRQGAQLSRVEKRKLAEYLTGKPFATDSAFSFPGSAYCKGPAHAAGNSVAGPTWNGWGASIANTRFQPAEWAGIRPADINRLKLKWAFGFPGDSSASAQPVVLNGRVYVGSWGGGVYSLDADTGCLYWLFAAEAGVRSAIVLGAGPAGLVAYFGDLHANVYAADASTGKLLWKVKLDEHPFARITGSPVLDGQRLYVPVASNEESRPADPKYECCTFRGSVVALDAVSGRLLWKRYTIADAPQPTNKNEIGTQLWGPAGGGVWSSPTIDLKRKALYIGTGNSYNSPPTATSDSIIALDLDSGEPRWVRQSTSGDTWNGSCLAGRNHLNCPNEESPDADYGSSPILVELKSGKRLLIAGQKSGMVSALDPDRGGQLVWQQRVGHGGVDGGIEWGPAADGDKVYVAIDDGDRSPQKGGGLFALDLATGKQVWSTPAPPCENRPCRPVQSAAVTVVPGIVFSGSADGHLRAYSTQDGKIIWDYDTVREFITVNGIKAKGGSISNGGAAVVQGVVFANSGYSHHAGIIPGNVFLAFTIH